MFSGLLAPASLESAALLLSISRTHSPHNPNKLVGVMLGCCRARMAVQWSLLTHAHAATVLAVLPWLHSSMAPSSDLMTSPALLETAPQRCGAYLTRKHLLMLLPL